MKKSAFAALALALCMGVWSCSQDKKDGDAATSGSNDSIKAEAPVNPINPGESFAPTTNIRYIDMDTLAEKYNLAKDVHETYMQALSQMQQMQQAKATEIQKFQQQMEHKYNNNGYLSQESMQGDAQKLQKMQADAQNFLANLEQKNLKELEDQNKQLDDSIRSFLVDYNKKHHYDAILIKASGLYWNPALDITNEVVEGLNARYNKQ